MSRRKLKLSPYTFLVESEENGSIAANLASGEVVRLTKHERSSLLNDNADFNAKLFEAGFLVEDQQAARQRVIARHRRACFLPAVFNLTLLPTLACNFACPYCFESGAPGKSMNEEIIKRVLRLTQNQAPAHLRTDLSWYGGEPLLEIDLIANTHPKISAAVLSGGGEFTASLTTNGYLLNKEVSLLLKELKIRFIHVTIDGNKEVHDKHRITKDGRGTFDQIISNLMTFLETYTDGLVTIRVNTEYNTATTILDTLKYIPPYYRSRIFINLSRIISDQCNERLSDELANLFKEIYKKIRAKGFKAAVDNCINPGPAVYCYAERVTGAVIDPEGFIFRCAYSDFSEEERTGILNEEGEPVSTGTFGNYWDTLVSTEPDECLFCSYLPLCGFGCPRKRLVRPFNTHCKNQFKFLPDTLTALAANR